MRAWTVKTLQADRSLSDKEKNQFEITLNWYLGYGAKQKLGEPTDRENGKIFWRHALEGKNPAEWQKKQWGVAIPR